MRRSGGGGGSADEIIDLDAVRAKRAACDRAAATLDAADLATLHVAIAELRVAPDGKWLYVVQVTCARVRWRVQRRYSAIRAFWEQLRERLAANEHSCTERCHFLAGLEADKFPKKHLVHTQSKLEERAAELETFFVRLVLRLNLCSRVQLERCFRQGCSLLQLLVDFFEIGARYADSRRGDPYAALTAYKSMQRLDDSDDSEPELQRHPGQRRSTSQLDQQQQQLQQARVLGGRKKLDRRFSFGALHDVRVALEPQS
ncbi:hypothetical protein PybrP1_005202 [[Pythium] brassicae (nom. inval.)]|nr:hypothetical protein PybrP1_005202 [[Pythium] brassicae (nom. inval.)]